MQRRPENGSLAYTGGDLEVQSVNSGQKRFPVCTGISLFMTIAVEVLILEVGWSARSAGFGAGAIVLVTLLAVAVGILFNAILGLAAHKGGEYWGGRIAALGVAVWLATIAWFYFQLHC
jgi:hypothetical protein